MKKIRKSHFQVNDPAVLTKNYAGYMSGHIFMIDDPNKYGKKYEIKVRDPQTGAIVKIPSKYLDDVN